jgi:hypothetical protein
MPAATKKRPPMEMEPGEGKAPESAESAAEETREGAEPDDAPKAKTNRKRSAKNAKATKAPMDGGMYGKKPMDGEGCNCGKRKAKCDGSYAKKMDRNDALTPQEYLAACDLGIQGRSRSYIRARLDAAERLDLKCGNGSISEGEKCTKGTAQKAAPTKSGRVRGALENTAIVAGTAGTMFSYGQVVSNAMRGNIAGASKALQREGAFATLAGAGMAAKGARTGNKELRKRAVTAVTAGAAAVGAGHLLGGGYTKGLGAKLPSIESASGAVRRGVSNLSGTASAAKTNITHRTAKARFERMYNRPGRRDSVYAAGFSPELDQLAV